MRLLYCPTCGEYLEGGDGECHDCRACGWKQPPAVYIEPEPEIEEIEHEELSLEQEGIDFLNTLFRCCYIDDIRIRQCSNSARYFATGAYGRDHIKFNVEVRSDEKQYKGLSALAALGLEIKHAVGEKY